MVELDDRHEDAVAAHRVDGPGPVVSTLRSQREVPRVKHHQILVATLRRLLIGRAGVCAGARLTVDAL